MNGSLGIDDLTIGVSAQGAWDYYDGLNTGAIRHAREAVLNTEDVKRALQAGWQGQAEANFEKNLDNASHVVDQELEKISNAIQSLISDLVEDWATQDNQMVEEESIVNF